jgi:hypothetical protein
MSITELSVAEFYYTVGRLIEAVDYILPTFKKVAETAPEAFGRLVELIETLQLSIKNSIEIHNYSSAICVDITPDISRLVNLCDGVRNLLVNRVLTTELVNETIENLLKEEASSSSSS